MKFKDTEQEVEVDRLTVVSDEMLSSDGYRLLWYHSTKKADHDARYRAGSLQRAIRELTELRERLSGPRTHFKNRKKVDEAVQEIVKRLKEESLLIVTVEEREEGTFRQAGKGRPGKTPSMSRRSRSGSRFPGASTRFAWRKRRRLMASFR